MDSTSSNLVMELFDEAALLDPPSRAKYLDQRCRCDAVRREVDSLLHAFEDAGGFLGESSRGHERARDGFEPHRPGSKIGNYELLNLLGEGGFAHVFRARQTHPVRRDVAIKIIKLGMDTRAVIARFELERQALAMMDHPGIAAVYDAGATDLGRPFFVMELVRGERITRFADDAKLDISARVKLFIDVCNAVHHAHQKGILHRDLKPSNILVTTVDGQPQPKIIDFGIAKATQGGLTDRTFMTAEHQMLGTPRYMSPEQATSGGADVDTRSDIYSLGTVLYELLTGVAPMQQANSDSPSSVITDLHRLRTERVAPVPSSRVNDAARRRELRGELDWIVLKCLDLDRAQRYESATALAADLRAHLDHRPIVAAAPSALYRVRKFVRRNAWAASAVAMVTIALIVGTIVSARQAIRATRAEQLAQRRLEEANVANDNLLGVNRFLAEDMIGAADPAVSRGRELTVREALDNAAKGLDKLRERPLMQAAVRHSVASAYLKLGLAEPALQHARLALDQRTTLLGETHRDTVKSLIQYAGALHANSRFAEAEAHAAKALALSVTINGDDHPDTIEARQTHGVELMRLARWAEAVAELERASRQCERLFGKNDHHTTASLNDYALALHQVDRTAESELIYRDLVETTRRSFGEDHPATITAMHNHARMLGELGRDADALAAYQQAFEQSRRVLGELSPSTVLTSASYAKMLVTTGRYRDAENLLRPSIASLRANDDRGRNAVIVLDAYAMLLQQTRRYSELPAIRAEVLDRLKSLHGEDHPETITALSNYAVALAYVDKRVEALPVYQQVLERRRQIYGDEHPRTLTALFNVASGLREVGRVEEAEPLSAKLYEVSLRAQISPALVATYRSLYGQCLVGLARFAEAEKPLNDAIRRFRETGQSQDARMLGLLRALAHVYEHTDRPTEQAALAEEIETLRQFLHDQRTQPATRPAAQPKP